ncbi:MAG: STAS domain-containing protein [Phycisphaerae bacterium]
MPVENWSDNILLVELADDPQFTDDLSAVLEQCQNNPQADALLTFANVSYLNSSNIAKLLKLRKLVQISNGRKLKLAAINRQVWGVFLVTGLDRIFEVSEDVPTGLASLQIGR